ncbi:MAG TPA: MlaD family protein [Candidatus Dormibacteraeota bacterium]|jgi:phospholipid/cholesterol/gamma-HCH transport system substrate-binding protein|nr:MlaD family protein [Candidatus Dormibacteraeota bacterium]
MEARREQVAVGLFVIVAAGLLVATVFALGGAFSSSPVTYRAYFPFAGGIEPGATVRYAGGPKIGRVEMLRIDPKDPTRMEITVSVKPGLPIKSDSRVRIMSMSPLGENHVEIMAGSQQATSAPPGTTLPSDPYVDFNAITSQLNDIAPDAKKLLATLNQRTTELGETIARVNDMLNAQNRNNLSATLSNARGMLEENRPALRSSLTQVEAASHKMGPLLDDLRKTSAEANQTLDHVDALVTEDRPEIHQAIIELRQNLAQLQKLTGQLNSTLDTNSENIDELLENFRHVSENLREFTEIIKTRPSTLIRSSTPKEHKPGQP